MTRVRTNFGDVHAAALRKGDMVLTRDGGYRAIEWLTRIRLDEHILRAKPDSNPIVLAQGSLGRNVPASEIMVSPRQVVCADAAIGLNGNREAAMLVSRPGVRRFQESSLSYTMFHVGEHAEVYCEGTFMVFPIDA
ncbi:MAG: Hint domain-containing protein [Silicimonas sp.]|nr:Hint domain-containing protein [Silicimonas sp.]